MTILSCKNTRLYASEERAKFCWTTLITRNRTRDRLYTYSVHLKPSKTGKTELTPRVVVHANGFEYPEEILRLSPMRSARVDAIIVPTTSPLLMQITSVRPARLPTLKNCTVSEPPKQLMRRIGSSFREEGKRNSISYARSVFETESHHSECVLGNKWTPYLVCEDEKNS